MTSPPDAGRGRRRRIRFALPLSFSALLAACGGGGGGAPPAPVVTETSAGCLACHVGLDQPGELVHEKFDLGCTDCHGGDATATDLSRAHVAPRAGTPVVGGDRVAPLDGDLSFLRFRNPSDFRVLSRTCGRSGDGTGTNCHQAEAATVVDSLMATNAGLFQGLGFETGFFASRTPGVGVFGATDDDGVVPAERGAVASLAPVGPENTALPIDSAARHASALPRESCVRCHLWSTGAGVRGESGHAGLYRSQGCAACHYEYADDGLYAGLDPTIDRAEPGHGVGHRLRNTIPTSQCAHCHNSGGADVGLSFQGLAEAPPGIPAGPGFAGTTDEIRYGAYHLADGFFVQPDVHFQAGLACIDCHTVLEAHGDGNIDVQMSLATEIRCEDCHGTLEADTTLTTSRGNPLPQIRKEGAFYFLRGKLDGADHLLKQVRQVAVLVDSGVFNPAAKEAMTPAHLRPPGQGGLECSACHSPWQSNHYATVLDRDFAAPGVDLVTGAPTPAAITNVRNPYPSATGLLRFRPFGLGRNSRGRVAPFVPSRGDVLATATDAAGAALANAATPLTVEGTIGLGHQPVFPHTTRNGARTCDECHRNPAAVGLGGEGLALARRLAVAAAGPDGVAVLDRTDPSQIALVSRVGATGARDATLVVDPATGRARTMAVAQGASGVLLVDVSTPESPVPVAGVPTTDARGLALFGSTLLVADGPGGVLAIDVSAPESPRLLAVVPTADARAIAVGFPYAYVADGAAGLAVLDVGDPAAPQIIETIDLNDVDPAPNDARDVVVIPLLTPIQFTDKPYQTIVLVADGAAGVRAVDVTIPDFRFPLGTLPTSEASGLAHATVFIAGDDSISPREADLVLVADPVDGLHLVELGTFGDLIPIGLVAEPGFAPVACAIGFDAGLSGGMRLLAHAATSSGELRVVDVTNPLAPAPVGLASVAPGGALSSIALEAVDLSRRVAEDGRPILGVPFPQARSFDAAEILAILKTEYPKGG